MDLSCFLQSAILCMVSSTSWSETLLQSSTWLISSDKVLISSSIFCLSTSTPALADLLAWALLCRVAADEARESSSSSSSSARFSLGGRRAWSFNDMTLRLRSRTNLPTISWAFFLDALASFKSSSVNSVARSSSCII